MTGATYYIRLDLYYGEVEPEYMDKTWGIVKNRDDVVKIGLIIEWC